MAIHINNNGEYSIQGLGEEQKQIAEKLLQENTDLIQRMLKTKAIDASISLDYLTPTDESLSIETTLADIHLKENVGYGIDSLDIFRLHSAKTDPALRTLLDEDPLLERQIYRYGENKYHGFTNSFSAVWTMK